jgi:membrane protein
VKRVWRRFWATQMPGRCAELAYYFLFAVFPLLLFLSTLMGYVAGVNSRLRGLLLAFVGRVAPTREVTSLLYNTLDQVSSERHGGRLSLSLLATIWVASNAVLAVVRTLNTICGLKETRSWWQRRLVAIGLTVGYVVLSAGALLLLLYGRELGESLAAFMATWHVMHWPLLLLFALLSFEAMYNYAPCRERGTSRPWGTPGAVLAVVVWMVASMGLRFYLTMVRGYAATTAYGSLGAVIVLLLWFYLTAVSLVVGGDLNAEIDRLMPRRKRQRAAAAAAAGTGAGSGRRHAQAGPRRVR